MRMTLGRDSLDLVEDGLSAVKQNVEFRVLGPVEAAIGDRLIVSGAGKQAEVLGILLARANHVVPSTSLIDDLWDYDPPKTANKTLQTYISQLRKAIGEDAIVSQFRGYRLSVDSGAIDAGKFESQLTEGRAAMQRGD